MASQLICLYMWRKYSLTQYKNLPQQDEHTHLLRGFPFPFVVFFPFLVFHELLLLSWCSFLLEKRDNAVSFNSIVNHSLKKKKTRHRLMVNDDCSWIKATVHITLVTWPCERFLQRQWTSHLIGWINHQVLQLRIRLDMWATNTVITPVRLMQNSVSWSHLQIADGLKEAWFSRPAHLVSRPPEYACGG